MSKGLDDIDVKDTCYVGFIKRIELVDGKHAPGYDTINSLQLNQSLEEIFISIMNGAYIMKDGMDTVYVNILGKHLIIDVDKYGIPDKSDMLKLYTPYKALFEFTKNKDIHEDLDTILDDINSGKLVYEE